MNKTWIITEFYFPNENTTSYIMTKIAEGLSEKADVSVITSTSAKVKGIKYERHNHVNIYRVKDSNLDKNNFLKRTIKLIILGLRLFFKAATLVKKNDTVMVVTNPATIIFLMRILKAVKKFELVILVHDIFPENLVVAKVLKPKNYLYRITLLLFNNAYNKSNKLIVIGRDMELFMKNKLGKNCPEIAYIPNFADVNIIKPQCKKQNRILLGHGLTEKFVVLFTGNIGRAQDIDNILNTMELLKENENIHLLIIGDGANVHLIQQFLKEKGLGNITLLPSIGREFSNDFLNAGDVGLVSLQQGRKGIGIPSKTYTFLAAGKPILAVVDKESEIYQMVNESGCGWVSEPGNPVELSTLIGKISLSMDEVEEKGTIARNLAMEKYSMEKIIPQFQMHLFRKNGKQT
jgi:glycosyltransferase involved in cell wall biosynthesis